jgi:diaminopropionate ammonia-lyase
MYINPTAQSWSSEMPIDPAVEAFHRSLPDYNTTPLVSLPQKATEFGLGHVLVKAETQRFGLPAFKIVGASYGIYRALADTLNLPATLSLEELGAAARTAGAKLVTSTEGNWGRAVARMGKYLNVPVTVYVPHFMDEATQKKIASEGATVIKISGDYDESVKTAEREAETTGAVLAMDTAWEGYQKVPEVGPNHALLAVQLLIGLSGLPKDIPPS